MKFDVREAVTSNVPYKVLSVLIALGLWFIVRDERVETEIQMRLQVAAPAEFVIVNRPARTLTVSVSGSRFALDRLRRQALPPFELVAAAKEPGPVEIRIQPSEIQLPVDAAVSQVEPSRVEVLLERKAERQFPVRVRLLGTVAEGFTVGRPTVEPRVVQVVGASGIIRDLDWVYTEPVSIDGRGESFAGDYELSLPSEQVWRAKPGPVRVTVPIVPLLPSPTPQPESADKGTQEGINKP